MKDAVATSASVYTILGKIDDTSSHADDGTITLIADKSLFGPLDPGDVVNVIAGTTRVFTNSQTPIAGGVQDQADAGGYLIRGNVCSAAAAVGGVTGATVATASKGRFGGALGLGFLLPLLGGVGLRRRRGHARVFYGRALPRKFPSYVSSEIF